VFENLDYNAELMMKRNKCFIVAKTHIFEGEEIYVGYGFDYWKWFYE